ncbi:MAG: hypothetical protein ABSB82_10970 [Terriglobia bacterium]|jgi:hypothetical protein
MAPLLTSAALGLKGLQLSSLEFSVRPNGADPQWVEDPPRSMSVSLVADKRPDRATGWAGAL